MPLPFWGRGTLKEALDAYLAEIVDDLAEMTVRDYQDRARWLLQQFGELTHLREVTFERLHEVLRKEGPRGEGLRGVTIKKRFVHLLAAMKFAAARGILRRDEIPQMPKIRNDGVAGARVLDLAEYKVLRMALQGRHRIFADLCFWTGHHTRDICHTLRWMLDPDFTWADDAGNVLARGRYWRRNHKNPACQETWFPMEPEFVEVSREMLAGDGHPQQKILGHVWGLSKAFAAACDRAEIPRVKPNQDLRRSFASMLSSRGYGSEYIRQAQGHEGSGEFSADGRYLRTLKPTVDTRHYLRVTNDLLVNELKRTANFTVIRG
jgi:integrase